MKTHPGGASTVETIISSDGTLDNVIVYVSEGLGDRTFDPPAKPVVIEHKGCTYRLHVLTMQANRGGTRYVGTLQPLPRTVARPIWAP